MKTERIFSIRFSAVHPLYVAKAVRKGRTPAEVDAVIRWLTGYTADDLRRQISREVDLRVFFAEAPRINPEAVKVTGTICGVRIEEIADPLMRNIRILDKLVDELAKGRSMEKILRSGTADGPPTRTSARTP